MRGDGPLSTPPQLSMSQDQTTFDVIEKLQRQLEGPKQEIIDLLGDARDPHSVRLGLAEDCRKASSAWGRAEADLKHSIHVRMAPEVDEAFKASDLGPSSSAAFGSSAFMAKQKGASPSSSSSLCGVARPCSDEDHKHMTYERSVQLAAEKEILLENKRMSRAIQLKERAADAAHQLRDNDKRKLKKQVTDICIEVGRRQKLRREQERARIYREKKFKRGFGPSPEIGDHTEEALGLLMLTGGDDNAPAIFSPRRVGILDALSLEDLSLLRKDTTFYFSAIPPVSPEDAFGGEHDEDLLQFFTPLPVEKDIPPEAWAQRLRKKLMPAVRREAAQAQSIGTIGSSNEKVLEYDPPACSFEKMPCLGRRPGVRDDKASPTLQKIREVYHKREMLDAKCIEDRREALAAQEAMHGFKAKTMLQAQSFQAEKLKELRKVHLQATAERKLQSNIDEEERRIRAEAARRDQQARGVLQAALAVETKRDEATRKIEAWHDSVLKGSRKIQDVEEKKMQEAEIRWNAYSSRLWKIGFDRHNRIQSQAQKNDELRQHIRLSMGEQIGAFRQLDRDALQREIDEKLNAAAERRARLATSKYNFIEQAFGKEATTFDHRHHAGIEVSRKSSAWQKSAEAEAWKELAHSFSEPAWQSASATLLPRH